MGGRYGPDHLGVAMIICSLVLYAIFGITGYEPVMYVSFLIVIVALYRILSRKISRRRAENDRFIRYWWPIKTKISRKLVSVKQRKTHKFLKCPSCSNTLRVPKGKGKLQITCPRCGERFIKKC